MVSLDFLKISHYVGHTLADKLTILKRKSGGELLEMRLLDSHLLDTFGSKSIARHKFYQLLESS